MANGFFASYGERIDFDDAADLADKLAALDLSVPRRTERRRSEHRERWCLARYLLALSEEALLRFPLTVEKREAPDFMLSHSEETTGLEITDAGTQRHQRAMSEAEKAPGTIIFGEDILVRPGPGLPQEERLARARQLPERRRHAPLVGDEPERQWAAIIRSRVESKTANLQGFPQATSHQLLIYDNTHLNVMTAFNPATAAQYLASEHEQWTPDGTLGRRFSLISVLRDSILLYDVGGTVRLLAVKDPAAG